MNRHRALEALSLSVCQPWKSWFNNSSLRYSAAPVNRKPFPVLPDTLDVNLPEIQSATRTAYKHIAKLAELKELVRLGGGEKAQASYVRKKVLPRDRITRILDDPDEDLLEIGIFAGLGMPYGDVPSAGTICCIGKVHGRYCMISATEGTFKGGTMFPITVTKQISVLDKAEKCGLPFVFFIDSGGAFLPLQSLLFPDKMGGGRVFYLESVLGSQGLPTVAVICGSCTAGGAYGPALCQEAGITDKTGTVFLGGPPLVKAALGYDIGAQELGGAELHSRVSGVTDYFLGTEDEGFDVVRDVIATTNYSTSDCTADTTWEEPLHDASHLDSLCGLPSLSKDQVVAVISRVADGSRFREFKAMYGSHLITGYAAVHGQIVGVVANFGSLTYADGLKGAHFLQICQQRHLPVLFLQNNATDIASSSSPSDEALSLRGRAAMATSLACLTSPKLVVCLTGCCNDDLITMCGPSFEPWFSFSWPSGFLHYDHNNFTNIGVKKAQIGDESGSSSSAQNKDKESRSRSKALLPGSCWYDASHMLIDGVIAPSQTRTVVAKCLAVSAQKNKLLFESRASPVYRL